MSSSVDLIETRITKAEMMEIRFPLQNVLLRQRGIDPNKEVMWWDDPVTGDCVIKGHALEGKQS